MFGWLARRRRLRDATYRFFDGRKWKRVDPIAVNLAYATHPTYNPDLHPKLAEVGDPAALQQILDATCSAFGVKMFDSRTEQGLTGEEILDLAIDFAEWENSKKNFGLPSPTSASFMAAMSESSNTSDPTPTLDSGSTPTAEDCEQPGDTTEEHSGHPND